MKADIESQKRADQINAALQTAYANASNLKISKGESKALMKPFGDKVIEILPDSGHLFIPHIFISERLNQVFGPGNWALICRRHWIDKPRGVFCGEHVLVVRGCFIGESIGEFRFDASEPADNLGDALESTAAKALRMIAGKRLSCGNEVWQPDYCETWKHKSADASRNESGVLVWHKKGKPPVASSEVDFQPASKPPEPRKRKGKKATDDDRHVMLQLLGTCGADNVLKYALSKGILKSGQDLTQWPLKFVAVTEAENRQLQAEIAAFVQQQATAANWRLFPMPFGRQTGKPLGEMDRGDLAGYWAEFTVETTAGGKPVPAETVARDRAFRSALDLAGKELNFQPLKKRKK